jgi:excisionase family DNA binding protein
MKLLSVAETAQKLGMKPATIRLWLATRKLPRVNCGRSVRIPDTAVDAFIEKNLIPAKEPRR